MIGLPLRFAIRNLRRHGRRALIMGLGIAVGVAAAVVHRGLVAGIRSQMIDHLVVAQYGHVAILPPLDAGPEGGEKFRRFLEDPDPIVELIRRELPRATVAPSLSTLGMAFGEKGGTGRIALWGIAPERDVTLMDDLHDRVQGDPAPLRAGAVYLGAALAERLEIGRGDVVTLSAQGPGGRFDALDLEVGEILEPGAPWQDYFVYLVLEDLQSLMGVDRAVGQLKLHLETGTRGVDAVAGRLDRLLQQAGQSVRVETYEETGRLYMGIIRAARIQAQIIEIVLLVAIALGVAGAQILSVHERRREIGTMTALGTPRALIRMVFVAEGAVLALVAGLAGAAIGVGITALLGRSGVGVNVEAFRWMVGGSQLIPRIDPAGVALTLVEVIGIVMLSALYPAARASRVPPIEALRGGSA